MSVLEKLYELQEFDIKNDLNIITEDDVNALIEHSELNWKGTMRINISDYPISMWLVRTRNNAFRFGRSFYTAYDNIMKVIDLKSKF